MFKKIAIHLSCVCVCVCALHAHDFSELNVSSRTDIDEQYKRSGTTYELKNIQSEQKDIDSIIRKAPSTFTNYDKRSGGLKVNMRSQTGLGRANVIIDGVLSTAIGTSSDDGGGYHENEGNNELTNSSFSAFVDPNFLVDANFSAGFARAGAGANTLVGAASFRTIDIDDIIKPNNTFGALFKAGYESNKMGPTAMLALAAKANIKDDFYAGLMFAYSMHKMSQDYKVGGGAKANDIVISDSDDEDNLIAKHTPILDDIKSLEQRPKSILAKAELGDDVNKFKLTYKNYRNTLSKRKISQNDVIFDYFAAPNNDLINLHFLAAYSHNNQQFLPDARIFQADWGKLDLALKNSSLTFNLSNNSHFDFSAAELDLNYGLGYLKNKYYKNYADYNKLGISEDEFVGMKDNSPITPTASAITKTAFIDADLNIKDFELISGISVSRINLKGFKPECEPENKFCFPHKAVDINKEFNTYNIYSQASYEFNQLFVPFVSLSYSTRAPNINEMFFINDGGDSINPFLRPEKALTTQLGANGYFESGDFSFGYKGAFYHTKISNYIYAMQFNFWDQFERAPYVYINDLNKVTLKGFDLSTNMDSKYLYAKLNYSYSSTNQPTSDTFGINPAFGVDRLSTMPKHKANLDLGVHLFDSRIDAQLGLNFIGKAQQIDLASTDTDAREAVGDNFTPLKTQNIPSSLTVDLSAKYHINPDIYLSFGVFNLFDKRYINPLDSLNASAGQMGYNPITDENVATAQNYARGRSFMIGINARF